jgi:hypothetical protein
MLVRYLLNDYLKLETMKLLILVFAIITLSPKSIFAQDCDFSIYAPVTGKDKKCYLNKCWAEKKGVKVAKSGYKKRHYKLNDIYTWPIEDVCIPNSKEQPVITNLEDGTLRYKYADREFRGTPNRCKCLPASAQITTSNGTISIDLLKQGDKVITVTANGEQVEMPIKIVNKVEVLNDHKMLVIELADGRKLQVTAGHPSNIPSKNLGDLKEGEKWNGSTIHKISEINYTEKYTYDILPEGETGYYFVNGILIGSTLTNYQRLISKK